MIKNPMLIYKIWKIILSADLVANQLTNTISMTGEMNAHMNKVS